LDNPPEILFFAAKYAHFAVFEFLIQKGADIFAKFEGKSLMVFLSEKRENDKLAALSKYIEKNYIKKP